MLTDLEILALVALWRLGDAAYAVPVREAIGELRRRPSLAAVYSALDRLEQRGLAQAWLSEPRAERGGRARRHYRLTTRGRTTIERERAAALKLWLSVPVGPGSRS